MFSPAALRLAPWSPSKVKLANQCPLAFRYKYIDRLREDRETIEARVGKAVHTLLELVTGGASLDGALALTLPRLELTPDEAEAVRPFHEGITAFGITLAAFRARSRIVRELREERVGLAADLTSVPFHARDVFFRGVWDLGFELADGRVVIVDHKTSKKADASYHADQLRAYAVQALARFPTRGRVWTGIHFVRAKKVVWTPSATLDQVKRDAVPWFASWINRAAERVATDHHPPVVSSFCGQCGYRPRCPAQAGDLVPLERRTPEPAHPIR